MWPTAPARHRAQSLPREGRVRNGRLFASSEDFLARLIRTAQIHIRATRMVRGLEHLSSAEGAGLVQPGEEKAERGP